MVQFARRIKIKSEKFLMISFSTHDYESPVNIDQRIVANLEN